MTIQPHNWSEEKRSVADNYSHARRVGSAFYFSDDAKLFDVDYSLLQEQHQSNAIYGTSYQQIIDNLKAGQPREQALEDCKRVLMEQTPVQPYVRSSRGRRS